MSKNQLEQKLYQLFFGQLRRGESSWKVAFMLQTVLLILITYSLTFQKETLYTIGPCARNRIPVQVAYGDRLINNISPTYHDINLAFPGAPFIATLYDYKNPGIREQYRRYRQDDAVFADEFWDTWKAVTKRAGYDWVSPLFGQTRTGPPFLLFIPAKNGSNKWKQLLLKLSGQEYQSELLALNPPRFRNLVDLPINEQQALMVDRRVRRFLFVRNPYVRLLSAYLDKIQGQDYQPPISERDNEFLLTTQDPFFSDLIVPQYASFGEFVRKLYAAYNYNNRQLTLESHYGINIHYITQSSMYCIKCGLDFDYILRVEEINSWYRPLVTDLDLESVVDYGWGVNGTAGCFLSTNHHHCDGPSSEVDQSGREIFKTKETDGHQTQASQQLIYHYDEELAQLVYEMYKEDFEYFNYPRWNGKDDQLRILQ